MIKLIFKSSRSLSFERETEDIYYANQPYDVYVNGNLFLPQVKTNVFSLFGLKSNTDYEITVDNHQFMERTLDETASLSVLDFGANPDGETDSTSAIQAAIFACPKGGVVEIPKGSYVVKPLFLKSNITIDLQEGATLLGSINRKDYPILPAQIIKDKEVILELSSWEGVPQPTFASIITGIEVEHASIIGEGTIDCQAQLSDWWINHKEMRGGAYRPKGIFLSQCSNIGLQGITVKNTPSWNLHPYFSSYLDFIDLKIISPKESPNTDGCNPESCDHVNVIGVDFSVGDDCIAIKSGKYDMGMKYRKPTSHMVVRNCHMAFGHGAVVLGSEMSGGIKDLTVSKCYFEKTDRGLRIKTRRGRGESAKIDGITFEHIKMDHVLTPLVMNMYYYCDDDGKTEYVWSKEKHPVDHRTPYLGSFKFKDMVCDNVHVAAGFFYGLPEQPIKSIELENIKFNYADEALSELPAMMSYLEPMSKQGLIFNYVDHVNIKNVEIKGQDGKEIKIENVKSYEVK